MSPELSPRALVQLRALREEISAGAGSAFATVRTLDDVSLTIQAGELVVIAGGVASGAASLVSAVAGLRAIRHGQRRVARGVQIRRGVIGSDACRALVQAWADEQAIDYRTTIGAGVGANGSTPTRLLYVLRVRAEQSSSAPVDAWRSWCAALRTRGGSVLLHGAAASHYQSLSSVAPHRHTVREPLPSGLTSHQRRPANTIRLVSLDAGRIVTADPARRPTSSPYTTDRDAHSSYDPYPTASPGS